jgi:hypothetical protein
VVNSLQWRLRSLPNFKKRVLHLVESQVVASIITKGRASSHRLRKAVDKLASLCIAGGIQFAVGYISTEDNPADIPSRWGSRERIRSKSIGRRGKARCWSDSQ